MMKCFLKGRAAVVPIFLPEYASGAAYLNIDPVSLSSSQLTEAIVYLFTNLETRLTVIMTVDKPSSLLQVTQSCLL